MKFEIGDIVWQWRNNNPTACVVDRINNGKYELKYQFMKSDERWFAEPHELFKIRNACIKRKIRCLNQEIEFCKFFLRNKEVSQ